jgi:hypothetical protein
MTGGGRPRAAGHQRSLGLRAARRPVGGGRSGRGRSPRPRGFEGGRWAAGLGQRTLSLPQAAARGGLGAPAAGSPMVLLPRGAGRLLSGRSRGPGRGPDCLGVRCPPAAAAGCPPRPSACLYCSALLGSLLFIFPPPSHPPCLPTSSLPCSLARSLALSLATSLPACLLARSLAPPLAPAAAATSPAPPPAPAPSVLANNDPGSSELHSRSRRPPARCGHPAARRCLLRGPRGPPGAEPEPRPIVRAELGRLPEPRRKSPGEEAAEQGAGPRGSLGALRPHCAQQVPGRGHLLRPTPFPGVRGESQTARLPPYISRSVPSAGLTTVPRGWTSSPSSNKIPVFLPS